MKKKSLTIIILLILFSTGCFNNTKKLSCTSKKNAISVEYNLTFKKDSVIKMSYSYDMDISNLNEQAQTEFVKKDFCPQIKKSLVGYEEALLDCKQKDSKNHLTNTIEIDKEKVSDTIKEKLSSLENAKKYFENLEYSCTIK